MPSNKATGAVGESCVAQYILRYRKWKILDRNVRLKIGEIDIVAQEKNTIIFVEVKAMESYDEEFRAERHFDARKAQKVRAVCEEYLIKRRFAEDTDWRIDLAAVTVDYERRNSQVRYYRNVAEA